METPYRNQALLDALLNHCKPQSMLCIAAGLTTGDQFIATRSIANWKKSTVNIHKVPAIFLLGN